MAKDYEYGGVNWPDPDEGEANGPPAPPDFGYDSGWLRKKAPSAPAPSAPEPEPVGPPAVDTGGGYGEPEGAWSEESGGGGSSAPERPTPPAPDYADWVTRRIASQQPTGGYGEPAGAWSEVAGPPTPPGGIVAPAALRPEFLGIASQPWYEEEQARPQYTGGFVAPQTTPYAAVNFAPAVNTFQQLAQVFPPALDEAGRAVSATFGPPIGSLLGTGARAAQDILNTPPSALNTWLSGIAPSIGRGIEAMARPQAEMTRPVATKLELPYLQERGAPIVPIPSWQGQDTFNINPLGPLNAGMFEWGKGSGQTLRRDLATFQKATVPQIQEWLRGNPVGALAEYVKQNPPPLQFGPTLSPIDRAKELYRYNLGATQAFESSLRATPQEQEKFDKLAPDWFKLASDMATDPLNFFDPIGDVVLGGFQGMKAIARTLPAVGKIDGVERVLTLDEVFQESLANLTRNEQLLGRLNPLQETRGMAKAAYMRDANDMTIRLIEAADGQGIQAVDFLKRFLANPDAEDVVQMTGGLSQSRPAKRAAVLLREALGVTSEKEVAGTLSEIATAKQAVVRAEQAAQRAARLADNAKPAAKATAEAQRVATQSALDTARQNLATVSTKAPQAGDINLSKFEKVLKDVTADETGIHAVAELSGQFADALDNLFGVDKASWPARVKNVANKAYSAGFMGYSPGYVARNTANNLLTAVSDGVNPFQSPTWQREFFTRWGAMPYATGQGIGGRGGEAMRSTRQNAVKQLQTPLGARDLVSGVGWKTPTLTLGQNVEKAFSQTIMLHHLDSFWKQTWPKTVARYEQKLVQQGLSPEHAALFGRKMRAGMNPRELRRALDEIVQGVDTSLPAAVVKAADEAGGAPLVSLLEDIQRKAPNPAAAQTGTQVADKINESLTHAADVVGELQTVKQGPLPERTAVAINAYFKSIDALFDEALNFDMQIVDAVAEATKELDTKYRDYLWTKLREARRKNRAAIAQALDELDAAKLEPLGFERKTLEARKVARQEMQDTWDKSDQLIREYWDAKYSGSNPNYNAVMTERNRIWTEYKQRQYLRNQQWANDVDAALAKGGTAAPPTTATTPPAATPKPPEPPVTATASPINRKQVASEIRNALYDANPEFYRDESNAFRLESSLGKATDDELVAWRDDLRKPPAEAAKKAIDLTGMGETIGDNFYDMMYRRIQAQDATLLKAAIPEQVVYRASQSGLVNNVDDIKRIMGEAQGIVNERDARRITTDEMQRRLRGLTEPPAEAAAMPVDPQPKPSAPSAGAVPEPNADFEQAIAPLEQEAQAVASTATNAQYGTPEWLDEVMPTQQGDELKTITARDGSSRQMNDKQFTWLQSRERYENGLKSDDLMRSKWKDQPDVATMIDEFRAAEDAHWQNWERAFINDDEYRSFDKVARGPVGQKRESAETQIFMGQPESDIAKDQLAAIRRFYADWKASGGMLAEQREEADMARMFKGRVNATGKPTVAQPVAPVLSQEQKLSALNTLANDAGIETVTASGVPTPHLANFAKRYAGITTPPAQWTDADIAAVRERPPIPPAAPKPAAPAAAPARVEPIYDDKARRAIDEQIRPLQRRLDTLDKEASKPVRGVMPPAITSELRTKRQAEYDRITSQIDALKAQRQKLSDDFKAAEDAYNQAPAAPTPLEAPDRPTMLPLNAAKPNMGDDNLFAPGSRYIGNTTFLIDASQGKAYVVKKLAGKDGTWNNERVGSFFDDNVAQATDEARIMGFDPDTQSAHLFTANGRHIAVPSGQLAVAKQATDFDTIRIGEKTAVLFRGNTPVAMMGLLDPKGIAQFATPDFDALPSVAEHFGKRTGGMSIGGLEGVNPREDQMGIRSKIPGLTHPGLPGANQAYTRAQKEGILAQLDRMPDDLPEKTPGLEGGYSVSKEGYIIDAGGKEWQPSTQGYTIRVPDDGEITIYSKEQAANLRQRVSKKNIITDETGEAQVDFVSGWGTSADAAKQAVAAMRQHLANPPANLPPLTPQQARIVRSMVEKELIPAMTFEKAKVSDMATGMRDFALGDYAARRNIHEWLSYIMPYSYWFTFTYKNWAQRLLANPQYISNYARVKAMLYDKNEEWFRKQTGDPNAKLPPQYEDQVRVNIGDDEVMLNLERTLNPLNAIVDDFKSRQRQEAPLPWGKDEVAQAKADKKPLPYWQTGAALEDVGNWGPTVHPLPLMAYALWLDKNGYPDAARQWSSYQTALDRLVRAITAKAREVIPGLEDVIPQGGTLLSKPLMDTASKLAGSGQPWFEGGDIWDQRQFPRYLIQMLDTGKITPEQMEEAAFSKDMAGAWGDAAQAQAVAKFLPTMASWLLGQGFKPHDVTDVQIDQMNNATQAIYDKRETATPEEYKQLWADLDAKYPWRDVYMMGRESDPVKRLSSFSWGVLDRLPPGQQRYQALEQAGITDAQIDNFYQSKGKIQDWMPAAQAAWKQGIVTLAAQNAIPSDATAADMQQAQAINTRIRTQALAAIAQAGYNVTTAGIAATESGYFEQPEKERAAYLKSHPELAAYWDAKSKAEADITAAERQTYEQYYPPSPSEQKQRALVQIKGAEFAKQFAQYQQEYYNAGPEGSAARKQFMASNPQKAAVLNQGWDAIKSPALTNAIAQAQPGRDTRAQGYAGQGTYAPGTGFTFKPPTTAKTTTVATGTTPATGTGTGAVGISPSYTVEGAIKQFGEGIFSLDAQYSLMSSEQKKQAMAKDPTTWSQVLAYREYKYGIDRAYNTENGLNPDYSPVTAMQKLGADILGLEARYSLLDTEQRKAFRSANPDEYKRLQALYALKYPPDQQSQTPYVPYARGGGGGGGGRGAPQPVVPVPGTKPPGVSPTPDERMGTLTPEQYAAAYDNAAADPGFASMVRALFGVDALQNAAQWFGMDATARSDWQKRDPAAYARLLRYLLWLMALRLGGKPPPGASIPKNAPPVVPPPSVPVNAPVVPPA